MRLCEDKESTMERFDCEAILFDLDGVLVGDSYPYSVLRGVLGLSHIVVQSA
jgi:hypothetical protein